MFIDYIPLLLVNMAAGLAALACYVFRGIESENPKSYAAIFAPVGLVAVLFGAHMAMTWPIPSLPKANLQFANVAFGEMSVLLGVLFLAAGLAIAHGWPLRLLAIYALLAGLAGIVCGVAIGYRGVTQAPIVTAIGFVATGLAGILTGPVLLWPVPRLYRSVLTSVLLASAGLWTFTACMAYWAHIERFSTLAK